MLKIAIPINLDALLLRAHGELCFPPLHLKLHFSFLFKLSMNMLLDVRYRIFNYCSYVHTINYFSKLSSEQPDRVE